MNDQDSKGPLVTNDVLLRAEAWLDRLEKTTIKLDQIAERLAEADERRRQGESNE